MIETASLGAAVSGDVPVKIIRSADSVKVSVNGNQVLTAQVSGYEEGFVSLCSGGTVSFKDFTVTRNTDADGMQLLDDFSNGLGKWDRIIESGRTKIVDEALRINGVVTKYDPEAQVSGTGTSPEILYTDRTFQNVRIGFDVKLNEIALPENWAGAYFHSNGTSGFWTSGGYLLFLTNTRSLTIFKGGSRVEIASTTIDTNPMDEVVHLEMEIIDGTLNVYVNYGKEPVLTVQDSTFTSGYFGLIADWSDATYDNVTYKDLGKSSVEEDTGEVIWGEEFSDDFEIQKSDWALLDSEAGRFSYQDGKLTLIGTHPNIPGTYALKNKAYTSLELSATMTIPLNEGWAGFGVGRSVWSGSVWADGYYLLTMYNAVSEKAELRLYNPTYGYVGQADVDYVLGTPVTFRMEVTGRDFAIYMGDSTTPVIRTTVPVYEGGFVTLCNYATENVFDSFSVKGIEDPLAWDEPFADDFTQNPGNWINASEGLGSFAIADGKLTVTGTIDSNPQQVALKNRAYSDMELTVDVTLPDSAAGWAAVSFAKPAWTDRIWDSGYLVTASHNSTTGKAEIQLYTSTGVGGFAHAESATPASVDHIEGETLPLRIVVADGKISIYAGNNSEPVKTCADENYAGGYVALCSYTSTNSFDNFTVGKPDAFADDFTAQKDDWALATATTVVSYGDGKLQLSGIGDAGLYALKDRTYANVDITAELIAPPTNSVWAGFGVGRSAWNSSIWTEGCYLLAMYNASTQKGELLLFNPGNAANQTAATAEFDYEPGTIVKLRMVVIDKVFRVYVDDSTTPVIETTVAEYNGGYVTLCNCATDTIYDSFCVKTAMDLVAVEGVTLDVSEKTLQIGENFTLTATVTPENAANRKVSWTSSNEAVATVDASGKVTAVGAGEATITVTTEDGGKTATCKVTVEAPTAAVESVALNVTQKTLAIGESFTLTATVTPANAANQKVSWTSSNQSVATVDENGKVTSIESGEAVITVTTEDGGKTATCKVTVTVPSDVFTDDFTSQKDDWALATGTTVISYGDGKLQLNGVGDAGLYALKDKAYAFVDVCAEMTVPPKSAGWAGFGVGRSAWDGSIWANGCYLLAMYNSDTQKAELMLFNPANTVNATEATAEFDYAPDTVVKFRMVVIDKLFRVYVDDSTTPIMEKYVEGYNGGYVTLCNYATQNQYDSFSVKALEIPVAVEGVTLNIVEKTLGTGDSFTLTATVTPVDATNQKVSWTSSNEAVATVDASGKVTAVGEGEATITVTTEDGGKTATCEVTVTASTVAVESVALNVAEKTLETGESFTLTATVTPVDATNQKVSWTSSNEAVATVDASGKVTAVGAGEATITVTTEDSGKTATCEVTVTASTVAVQSVALNVSEKTLETGKSFTLTATVAPANATNQRVSWTSSNEAVATVNATGKVTAVGTGEATITVTTEDGGKTATCEVTVTAPSDVFTDDFTEQTDDWALATGTTAVSYGDGKLQLSGIGDAGLYALKDRTYANVDITAELIAPPTNSVWAGFGVGRSAWNSNIWTEGCYLLAMYNAGTQKGELLLFNPGNAANQTAATAEFDYEPGTIVKLRMVVVDKVFRVYVNDSTTPVIETTVAEYNGGYVTLCNCATDTIYDSFSVKTATVPVAVESVTLNTTEKTLETGNSFTLTATVAPVDAANQKVSWTSSNEAVATVDASGKVTAVGAGEATITVTTEDGSKTATCEVTVTASTVAVESVALNVAEKTLETGKSFTLTATVAPVDATNQKVSWTSSNEAVATVDASGKVTAVGAGEATITVTTEDGSKTATCKVTVKESTVAVGSVALNVSEKTLETGNSFTLTATVAPTNATNQKVSWTSANKAVATVDASGKVTAVGAGEATITVTTEDGGKTATCKVTVKEPTVAVGNVALNVSERTLTIGNSFTLTATVTPANATNQKVSWTSSNEAVATVDASGKVTAVAAGNATITVTTEDGSKKATCTVTVTARIANTGTNVVPQTPVKDESANSVVVKDNVATVPDALVEEILKDAEKGNPVTLPLTDNQKESVNTVFLTKDAVEQLAGNGTSIVLELTDASVSFDQAALTAIAAQAEGNDIEIRLSLIDESELSDEQYQTVADKEAALIVSANIYSDGQYIGQFNGGKATLAIPFTAEEGKEINNYKVYYVPENGELIEMNASYANGCFVFETTHFSEYAVIYEATAPEEIEGDVQETTPEATQDTVPETTPEKAPVNDSSSSFPWWIVAVVVIAAIAIVVVIFVRKKGQKN